MREFRIAPILLLILASLNCGGEKPADTPRAGPPVSPDEATGGTLTGKVAFKGTAPAPRPIDMSANPQCERTHKGQMLTTDDVVVNPNGTLRNVFVWIKAGVPDRNWAVPATPVPIDQQSCMYGPHVLGAMTRQNIQISNSDPTNHNIQSLPQINQGWSETQSPGEAPKLYSFSEQEVMIPVKCNVHPWMRAYIGVVGHPFFAVTGSDGSFTIKGLPPGTYTIQAWHEKYGTQEQQITVGAAERKTIDFSYQ